LILSRLSRGRPERETNETASKGRAATPDADLAHDVEVDVAVAVSGRAVDRYDPAVPIREATLDDVPVGRSGMIST